MDILSHGLWGGAALGKKKREFWTAFAFGALPDFVPFGTFVAVSAVAGALPFWGMKQPAMADIPAYVTGLYAVTHSFVTFGVAFALAWIVRKRKVWTPMWAWALHIAMDIPGHSSKFFGTPFLWPLSNYQFDGRAWSHSPLLLSLNFGGLALAYGYRYARLRKRRAAETAAPETVPA